jgi:NAD(P)-dependent dehydrogenase (short-subunit alcohol dehydrogenase family)
MRCAPSLKRTHSITSTVCDVSDRSTVERMVKAATTALGGLDVLVNNAGISGPTAPVEEMDPDAWEAVLRVNLTGTFNVTRLSIPYLRKSGSGGSCVYALPAERLKARGVLARYRLGKPQARLGCSSS